jgi:hypothetical protein
MQPKKRSDTIVGAEYEVLHQVFETGAAPTSASGRRVEGAQLGEDFIDELFIK